MPNHKPGDHPYTDIVLHDMDVPTEEISKIVRHIAESGNDKAKNEARRLLWNAGVSSVWDQELSDDELEQLTRDLYSLAAELRLSENYLYESPLDACLEGDDTVHSIAVRQLARDIYQEIEEDVENDWWVYRDLNGIMWEFGWETDRLDELEARLREFRDGTVREQ